MSRDPNAAFLSGAPAVAIGRCRACGTDHWYARAHCPRCMSTDVQAVDVEQRGVVHSFTVDRRPSGDWAGSDHVVLAYVDVGGGLIILAHLVDCHPGEVRIGMPVVGVPASPSAGTQVAQFRPHAASEEGSDA